MISCGCHPPFQRQITIVEKSRLVAPAAQWAVPISPPAVGLFLVVTFGNFEPHTSMASCGYHPIFQHKTTIVEKSGLVAPDFFRQYHSVCRRKLQKTDVRTRQNSAHKLSLPQNERREYHVGTPCEGSLINCRKVFGIPKPFFQKGFRRVWAEPTTFASPRPSRPPRPRVWAEPTTLTFVLRIPLQICR